MKVCSKANVSSKTHFDPPVDINNLQYRPSDDNWWVETSFLESNDSKYENSFYNINSDDSNVANSYQTPDFELGQYGLPDEGYDDLKYFTTTGQGGGVYIIAGTVPSNQRAVTTWQELSSVSPPFDRTEMYATTENADDNKIFNAVWKIDSSRRNRRRTETLDSQGSYAKGRGFWMFDMITA